MAPAPTVKLTTETATLVVESDFGLTTWLNTANDDEPPAPSEWMLFEYAGGSLKLEFSECDKVDLLQIIAYPEGPDDQGMPQTAEYTHICGGGEGKACSGSDWGETTQVIDEIKMRTILEITPWIAISPICLFAEDASSSSYIFFLRHTTV